MTIIELNPGIFESHLFAAARIDKGHPFNVDLYDHPAFAQAKIDSRG